MLHLASVKQPERMLFHQWENFTLHQKFFILEQIVQQPELKLFRNKLSFKQFNKSIFVTFQEKVRTVFLQLSRNTESIISYT